MLPPPPPPIPITALFVVAVVCSGIEMFQNKIKIFVHHGSLFIFEFHLTASEDDYSFMYSVVDMLPNQTRLFLRAI